MQNAELKTIELEEPSKKRGLPFMEALSVKASAREWSDRDLSLQDLFCAAIGIATRPRASMDKEAIRNLLGLGHTQYVFLNHPIGYPKLVPSLYKHVTLEV